jgi:hypothetical protein
MLSGPGALFFLRALIAFDISALDGLLQFMESCFCCWWYYIFGDGWLRKLLKGSAHLFNCSSSVFFTCPVCLCLLPAKSLVVLYRAFMLLFFDAPLLQWPFVKCKFF